MTDHTYFWNSSTKKKRMHWPETEIDCAGEKPKQQKWYRKIDKCDKEIDELWRSLFCSSDDANNSESLVLRIIDQFKQVLKVFVFAFLVKTNLICYRNCKNSGFIVLELVVGYGEQYIVLILMNTRNWYPKKFSENLLHSFIPKKSQSKMIQIDW